MLSAEDDATYANMEKDLNDLSNEIRRMERRDAIMDALMKGTKRNIETEPEKKLTGGQDTSDEEVFARLIFYGVTLLNRTEEEVWLMPLGHLLDQWEIYKQFNGLAKAKREHFIDEVIPYGI